MRGMDTSLVFAIIFAIIVIGLILVFGYQQIGNMFCFNGAAQVDKAVKDMENEVNVIYNLAEGASKQFKVSIPSGSSICVINTSDPSPAGTWLPNPDTFPIISSTVRLRNANILITYNCGGNEQAYRIDHLDLARRQASFCVGSGGTIYVENAGDYVAASPG